MQGQNYSALHQSSFIQSISVLLPYKMGHLSHCPLMINSSTIEMHCNSFIIAVLWVNLITV